MMLLAGMGHSRIADRTADRNKQMKRFASLLVIGMILGIGIAFCAMAATPDRSEAYEVAKGFLDKARR